jgi:hypothetical protein
MENSGVRSSCVSNSEKDEKGIINRGKFPSSQKELAHECKLCKVKPQKSFSATLPGEENG